MIKRHTKFLKLLTTALITTTSAIILTGCKTSQMMSVQEAKNISTSFKSLSLRIPERTIHDPGMRPDLLSFFEARPNVCNDPNNTSSKFFHQSVTVLTRIFNRGDLVGQTPEEIRYLKDWDVTDLPSELTASISKAYERMGETIPAFEWLKRSARLSSGGRLRNHMGQLAYLAALNGDTEASRKYVSLSRGRSSDNWSVFWRARGEGAYLEAVGRLDEAARAFENARSALKTVTSDNPRYNRILSHLSWIRMKQGRLVEAEAILIMALGSEGMSRVSAMPIRNSYSTVLYEQGRYVEAADMAKLTISLGNLDCVLKSSIYRAEARNNLARSYMALGKWKKATEQYDLIQSELGINQGAFNAKFAGAPDHALSLIKSNQPDRAIPMLESRLVRLTRVLGNKHYDTVETKAFLAMAYAQAGSPRIAVKMFAEAVPLMLQRSRQSETHSEGTRSITFKRRMVLESYIGLLANIRGTSIEASIKFDVINEAFKIADAARSSKVERMLARNSARAAVLNPRLADLARREQDLQRQISAQWASLSAGTLNGVINDATQNDARNLITKLRIARAALMQEIEHNFPGYAELINPPRISVEAARGLLRENERLLSVYIGDRRTFVWNIPKSGAIGMHVVERSRNDIGQLIHDVRTGLDPRGIVSLADIPDFDVAAGNKLFNLLFAESAENWQDGETLIYVPHAALGTLPLAVLPMSVTTPNLEATPLFSGYRNVDWIINTFDIATLPSVSSLRFLRGMVRKPKPQLSFAGFGDPIFSDSGLKKTPESSSRAATLRGAPDFTFRASPQTTLLHSAKLGDLPQLPDTGYEIRELALVLGADPSRDIYLGASASEESVKSAPLEKYKVLAFATHGLVSGDLDGLRQPALAMSSPKVTESDEDGLLTMDEIMALRLDADWIILSACNTGAADGSGAEAISGLGGAFFYAGARAMLVTYWPVETTSARLLTTDLFKRQIVDPTLSKSEAAGQSYRYLINHSGFKTAENQMVFSYSHPIFWGAFGLIGLP